MVNLFLLLISLSFTNTTFATKLPLHTLVLPKNFNIAIYADNVPGARQMALADNGTVYVGTRHKGVIYAISPSGKVTVVAKNLDTPNGVAIKDGNLYVAEINRILRFDNIANTPKKLAKPKIINATFPTDREHGWKYIAFGPDGYLYVPVGAPCNICLSKDKRYATIMRMKPDGSDLRVYANGVRNTVGFDWHPVTQELWFTDNGRDWMGDNLPPDELNHAPKPGGHFGYPFRHGKDVIDPKYGKQVPVIDFIPPVYDLPAHVAALGMSFYTGEQFPEKYRNQIIIPEHGSWNRSNKSGYRLSLVTLDGNQVKSYTVFASGWLQDQKAWGRPVDTLVMQDGSLLVSDDMAGVIYRISYDAKQNKELL